MFIILVSHYHSNLSLVWKALILCENGKHYFITIFCIIQLFCILGTKQVIGQVYLNFEVSKRFSAHDLTNKLTFNQLSLYLKESIFLLQTFIRLFNITKVKLVANYLISKLIDLFSRLFFVFHPVHKFLGFSCNNRKVNFIRKWLNDCIRQLYPWICQLKMSLFRKYYQCSFYLFVFADYHAKRHIIQF